MEESRERGVEREREGDNYRRIVIISTLSRSILCAIQILLRYLLGYVWKLSGLFVSTLLRREGIIPQKDYVLAERLVVNDSSHAAGMQGQPQSLDDMTDGQIEERFYQSVAHMFVMSVFCGRVGLIYTLCLKKKHPRRF